jgi:hypothetical protein
MLKKRRKSGETVYKHSISIFSIYQKNSGAGNKQKAFPDYGSRRAFYSFRMPTT